MTLSAMSDQIECACGCGQMRSSVNSRGQAARFIRCHNIKGSSRSDANPRWKGGLMEHVGYTMVLLPQNHPFRCMCTKKGYVRRHRLVMALHLGRPLLDTEIVHHKDHNRKNDDIRNLELYSSKSEHMKEHMTTARARSMQARRIPGGTR